MNKTIMKKTNLMLLAILILSFLTLVAPLEQVRAATIDSSSQVIRIGSIKTNGTSQSNMITGHLWHVPEAIAENAIPANVPTTSPDVTFDVISPLNFNSSSGYTIGAWLTGGGAYNVVENTPGTLNSIMDNYVTGTLIEFVGSVSITKGQTFTVTHDDGLTLIRR